jgi:imidazolonepropionase-like amidohydrolase
VFVENGRITNLVSNDGSKTGAVVDLSGKYITAGLVDMHSHIGVYAYPSTFGTDDGNEMTSPISPYVRVIDAYNAHDPAIDDIVAGGITTIQVLPGSGNAMGGQGGVNARACVIECVFH